jgi:hypothetical protein
VSFTFRAGPERTVQANLEDVEAEMLGYLFGQLLDLLGSDEDETKPGDHDPLAVELGLTDLGAEPRSVAPPEDPALARLFPDAYPDDEKAAAEFRRYTESELRDGKRDRARCALDSLPAARGGRFELDERQALCWLGTLNDLRLVLGARFGITQDDEQPGAGLDPDDPLRAYVPAYQYLAYLQEALLAALPR